MGRFRKNYCIKPGNHGIKYDMKESMLFDLNGKELTKIPHTNNYKLIRERLSEKEYNDIVEALENRIDSDKNEVITSSWIPGKNWEDTVFWPIYEKAANQNVELAGLFFGLIVWVVFMEHPKKWTFVKHAEDESMIR